MRLFTKTCLLPEYFGAYSNDQVTTYDNHRYIITITADPQCIFDFQSTGNKDVALDTAAVNTKVVMETEILGEV